jgi:hypothetical protein
MAKNRALTEVRTRELLSDVLQRASGERLRVFTVRQWFEHFARQKRKSNSERGLERQARADKESSDTRSIGDTSAEWFGLHEGHFRPRSDAAA